MARRFLSAFDEFVDSLPQHNSVLFRSSLKSAAENLALAAPYDFIRGEVTIRSTPALLRSPTSHDTGDTVERSCDDE